MKKAVMYIFIIILFSVISCTTYPTIVPQTSEGKDLLNAIVSQNGIELGKGPTKAKMVPGVVSVKLQPYFRPTSVNIPPEPPEMIPVTLNVEKSWVQKYIQNNNLHLNALRKVATVETQTGFKPNTFFPIMIADEIEMDDLYTSLVNQLVTSGFEIAQAIERALLIKTTELTFTGSLPIKIQLPENPEILLFNSNMYYEYRVSITGTARSIQKPKQYQLKVACRVRWRFGKSPETAGDWCNWVSTEKIGMPRKIADTLDTIVRSFKKI